MSPIVKNRKDFMALLSAIEVSDSFLVLCFQLLEAQETVGLISGLLMKTFRWETFPFSFPFLSKKKQ